MTRRPDTSELLPLADYDLIVVSFSGGKDSLACVLDLLERGVPRDRIELWHQHVDGAPGSEPFMDWPVTEQYVRAVGEALGIVVRFQWKDGGFQGELMREDSRTRGVSFEDGAGELVQLQPSAQGKATTRRKFPQVSADLSVRWCSAYLKIDVCARALAADPRFKSGTFLLVTGERREESSARSKYAEVERHRRTSKSRRVDQWRSVLDWREAQVWSVIERWQIVPHPAYRLGWGRVSCMACIFGDKDQWASVQELAPVQFNRIADLEQEFDHTIQRDRSVRELAAAGTSFVNGAAPELRAQAMGAGTLTAADVTTSSWTRPAGAFKTCGGPT